MINLVLVINVLDNKVNLGANAMRYSESFTFSRSEATTRIDDETNSAEKIAANWTNKNGHDLEMLIPYACLRTDGDRGPKMGESKSPISSPEACAIASSFGS